MHFTDNDLYLLTFTISMLVFYVWVFQMFLNCFTHLRDVQRYIFLFAL